ncbi:MAG: potassium transporter TrkG [Desulfobacterales bacterium]
MFTPVYRSIGEALRFGSFQVISIVTTTGFATADFNQWPGMSKLILLFLMFLGASVTGSTGGGMKCMRIMICFKYCYKELFESAALPRGDHCQDWWENGFRRCHPEYSGVSLPFIWYFCCLCSFSGRHGRRLITAVSAVASSIGNIGPGLNLVGPVGNFAQIPVMGKWLLIWCMLLGRLEIYTVIIFLVPEFWRK